VRVDDEVDRSKLDSLTVVVVESILAQSKDNGTAPANTTLGYMEEFVEKGYAQNVLVLAIVVACLLTLKLLLRSCRCFSIMSDPCLKDAVYVLFREVVIVAAGALVIQTLDFYGVITLDRERALAVSYCLVTSVALWTGAGLAFVMSARSQLAKWADYEQADAKEL
jgi:hypothetical protein